MFSINNYYTPPFVWLWVLEIQGFLPICCHFVTCDVFVKITCAVLRTGCWDSVKRVPVVTWSLSHWPSAGNPGSYQPFQSPSLSSTETYNRSYKTHAALQSFSDLVIRESSELDYSCDSDRELLLADVMIETCDTLMGPVFAQRGQNVS